MLLRAQLKMDPCASCRKRCSQLGWVWLHSISCSTAGLVSNQQKDSGLVRCPQGNWTGVCVGIGEFLLASAGGSLEASLSKTNCTRQRWPVTSALRVPCCFWALSSRVEQMTAVNLISWGVHKTLLHLSLIVGFHEVWMWMWILWAVRDHLHSSQRIDKQFREQACLEKASMPCNGKWPDGVPLHSQ